MKDYYRDLLESLTLEAEQQWDKCECLRFELKEAPEIRKQIHKLIKVEVKKYWDLKWEIRQVRIQIRKENKKK